MLVFVLLLHYSSTGIEIELVLSWILLTKFFELALIAFKEKVRLFVLIFSHDFCICSNTVPMDIYVTSFAMDHQIQA
jgi:hypothetical protein